jgi:hypothetical protein
MRRLILSMLLASAVTALSVATVLASNIGPTP